MNTRNGLKIKDSWLETPKISGPAMKRNIENVMMVQLLYTNKSHITLMKSIIKILIKSSIVWTPDGKNVMLEKSENTKKLLTKQPEQNSKKHSKKNLTNSKMKKDSSKKLMEECKLRMNGNNGLPITITWTEIMLIFGIAIYRLILIALLKFLMMIVVTLVILVILVMTTVVTVVIVEKVKAVKHD